MIPEFLQRTELLIGTENLKKIINSKIIVFGVGGVGGGVVEALTRAGVGQITIVDFDIVDITNLNRQIISNISNVGVSKVKAQKDRILSINSFCKIEALDKKVSTENIEDFSLANYDYVIDAIDDVDGKIAIIKYCYENNIKVISAMGVGKRLDPTKLKVSDVNKTRICPLARKMRKKLRDLDIKKLKVVYSEEEPINISTKVIPSISFLPTVAGMIIASEVVKDLLK